MSPNIWLRLYNFFDSNFFIGIITLLVGLVAFRVYIKQKIDTKRDAANVILLEIEDAERQLDKINIEKPIPNADQETIYLMKTASWDKNKYLFVRDFDRNEWDKITTFYRKCVAYDEAVVLDKESKINNQASVRGNIQRILADHTAEFVNELDKISKEQNVSTQDLQSKVAGIEQAYKEKRAAYIETLVGEKGEVFVYVPKQADFDAKKALANIEGSLTLTSVGMKLKKISQQSKLQTTFIQNILKSMRSEW